jgi:hypothetical protein
MVVLDEIAQHAKVTARHAIVLDTVVARRMRRQGVENQPCCRRRRAGPSVEPASTDQCTRESQWVAKRLSQAPLWRRTRAQGVTNLLLVPAHGAA